MMHRYMFYRMANGHFLLGLVALLVVVGIVLLIVYLTSRKYKSPAAKVTDGNSPVGAVGTTTATNPTQERLLSLLTEQKTGGGMGTAEYEERRLVLEGGRSDNHANAELVSLKERYAHGELTTSAYVEARNKLLGLL